MDHVNYPALRQFLDDSTRSPEALRYHEAQGFLFTIASAPELVSPEEWLPVVLEDLPDDRLAAEAILGETMTLYNEIVEGVTDGAPALPEDCPFRDDVLANLADDAPVSQWSRGFAKGHGWLEETWDALAPEELDEDIGSAMLVLSFFASSGVAQDLMAGTGRIDLREMAEQMRELFPITMAEYAAMGLEIDAAAHTPVRVEKVGRNEPCPCGSGNKYKKCCGA